MTERSKAAAFTTLHSQHGCNRHGTTCAQKPHLQIVETMKGLEVYHQ